MHPRVIHLASDHAGFLCKEAVKAWLTKEAVYTVIDHGAQVIDHEDDFPDYISRAAREVSRAPQTTCAIIFGGSGNGEAMMANRFLGVRAAVYYGGDQSIVTLSREHNDANILSIGARFVSIEEAITVIDRWLKTAVLPEEKRIRRNQKIEFYTKESRSV